MKGKILATKNRKAISSLVIIASLLISIGLFSAPTVQAAKSPVNLPPTAQTELYGPYLIDWEWLHSIYAGSENVKPNALFYGAPYVFGAHAPQQEGYGTRYTFNWGDNRAQETFNYDIDAGVVLKNHTWASTGTYIVQVKAEYYPLSNPHIHYSTSNWNRTTITVNDKPLLEPIYGPYDASYQTVQPNNLFVGTLYVFGDHVHHLAYYPRDERYGVRYEFDFGDNSPIQAYEFPTDTGMPITSHVWTAAGTYNIRARAGWYQNSNTSNIVWSNWNYITLTVHENLPTVAIAGQDQVVEQTSPKGAIVTLNGAGSYDLNNNPLAYTWTWSGGSASGVNPTVLFPAGITTVTLTVSDSQFAADDKVNITVQDTTAPLVNAGKDLTVKQWSHGKTKVTLYGSATDVADKNLSFTWREGNVVLGTSATLTYKFSSGTHKLTLTATDDSGNTGNDSVIVKVVDILHQTILSPHNPKVH